MNETTFLIAQSGSGDSCDSPSALSRFESFRASARSVTDSVSESMNRIGILGSVAIAVNSLTGPAMLCLPATYQRSGLIPTTGTRLIVNDLESAGLMDCSFSHTLVSLATVVIIFVCALSALCCLHMSSTISKVPNNQNFSSDVSCLQISDKLECEYLQTRSNDIEFNFYKLKNR